MRVLSSIFLVFALAACEPAVDQEPAPNAAFLASDAHFRVGDLHLILPLVAVRNASAPGDHNNDAFFQHRANDRLQESALALVDNPDAPMPAAAVEILITTYKYYGEHAASLAICPLLTQDWAIQLCRGNRPGALADLPQRFSVVDRGQLSQRNNHYTVGLERQGEQIAAMDLDGDAADITCDRQSRFCTAAIATSPQTLAIWSVWPTDSETAQQRAHRQGQAIVALVRNEISQSTHE